MVVEEQKMKKPTFLSHIWLIFVNPEEKNRKMFKRQFKWGVFLLKNNKGLQEVNRSQPETEKEVEKQKLAWLRVRCDNQGQKVGFSDPLI